MKGYTGALVVLAVLAWIVPGRVFAQDLKWENISREITGGNCVQADASDSQTIYFGTAKGLYKTQDNGLSWKNILRDRDMVINHIAFDPADTTRIYAATSKGIYASSDSGATWKNIYRSANAYEADCRIVAAVASSVYAGTGQGLITSADSGLHWNKESGVLGKIEVVAITADTKAGHVYLVCIDGVYRKDISGGAWEKIFASHHPENGADFDDPSDESVTVDQPEQVSSLRYISVDPYKAGCVYLATSNGVLTSDNSGLAWRDMTGTGLLSKDVRIVAVGEGSQVYAVTKSDICVYTGGQWRILGTGLMAQLIRGVACAADSVYAACDTGLYRLQKNVLSNARIVDRIDEYSRGLPSISSVQKAAIAYADVDMAKIREWRTQARRKALLPSVDVGINQDKSDLWHWEGGSTTKDYDDTLRKGKEVYEWDVNLSWDFSDLIWNESQTSIDTRARLLVQLRDDILDEVTKLYFEYIRVRVDMDSLSFLDKKKRAEKEIRLTELAAQLDGLTDNYFTSH